MNNPINFKSVTRRVAAVAVLASFALSNAFALAAHAVANGVDYVASATTAKYTTDLTQLGRNGRLQENLSLESETARLVKMLSEGGVRQPVVVDEDKAVQDGVVEQAAIRIAAGQVPASLVGRSILKVESAKLFSNANSSEEAAKSIDSIVADAGASNGRLILYIDSLADLVGPKAVTQSLMNAVSTGQVTVIGGTNGAEYATRIASQPDVANFFAGILIAEKANASAMASNAN